MSRSRSGRQPRSQSPVRRFNRADLVQHKRKAAVALLPTDPMAWDHSAEDAREIAADLAVMEAEIWFEVPPLTDEELAELFGVTS